MAGEKDRTTYLRCSFCGKTQDEVKKLVAGPTVYICNECIALCNDILKEEEKDDSDLTAGGDDSPAVKVGVFQRLGGTTARRRSPWARVALRKMTFEMIGASQIGEITSSQCRLVCVPDPESRSPRPEDQTGVVSILVYKLQSR